MTCLSLLSPSWNMVGDLYDGIRLPELLLESYRLWNGVYLLVTCIDCDALTRYESATSESRRILSPPASSPPPSFVTNIGNGSNFF